MKAGHPTTPKKVSKTTFDRGFFSPNCVAQHEHHQTNPTAEISIVGSIINS